jgi:hypothetical protein
MSDSSKQIGQLCTLVVEREKKTQTIASIACRWQSNHSMSTRATLYEREHDFNRVRQ